MSSSADFEIPLSRFQRCQSLGLPRPTPPQPDPAASSAAAVSIRLRGAAHRFRVFTRLRVPPLTIPTSLRKLCLGARFVWHGRREMAHPNRRQPRALSWILSDSRLSLLGARIRDHGRCLHPGLDREGPRALIAPANPDGMSHISFQIISEHCACYKCGNASGHFTPEKGRLPISSILPYRGLHRAHRLKFPEETNGVEPFPSKGEIKS